MFQHFSLTKISSVSRKRCYWKSGLTEDILELILIIEVTVYPRYIGIPKLKKGFQPLLHVTTTIISMISSSVVVIVIAESNSVALKNFSVQLIEDINYVKSDSNKNIPWALNVLFIEKIFFDTGNRGN